MASRDLRVSTFSSGYLKQAKQEFRRITIVSSATKGTKPYKTQRETNAIIANAYGAMVEHWHKHFRPKHFKNGAYAEYGYKPRSNAYNKRKREKVPLVFSGYSRAASENYRVVKSVNGARAVMPLVKAFNFKPANSKIDMRKEFLTTSERELATYKRIALQVIRKEFQAARRKGLVKIRVNI